MACIVRQGGASNALESDILLEPFWTNYEASLGPILKVRSTALHGAPLGLESAHPRRGAPLLEYAWIVVPLSARPT